MEEIPAPTKPFLDTTFAAKMAKALVVLYMANILLLYGVIFTVGFFYDSMPSFYWFVVENATDIEKVSNVISILIYLTCGIFFAIWTYRTHANFGNRHYGVRLYQENESSMAGWCYFIPFVNFYLPAKIVTENWENFQSVITQKGGGISKRNHLILPWWILFIAAAVISRISDRIIKSSDEDTVLIFFLLVFVLRFAAGVLAILMINRFMNTEREALSLVANPNEATVYNSLIVK